MVLDTSTHPPHWSDRCFFFHGKPTLFLAITSATLVLGPISLLLTWRLKHQVKALAKSEDKMDTYWGANKQPILGSISRIQQPES